MRSFSHTSYATHWPPPKPPVNLSPVTTSLDDFVGYGDQHGLTFVRVHTSQKTNDAYTSELGSTCGRWGYIGGEQDNTHNGLRITSRTAVTLQCGSATGCDGMQDVEWYFCEPTLIKSATVWPVHAGHGMLRGTLQYYTTAGWQTAAAGVPVNDVAIKNWSTDGAGGDKLVATNAGSTYALRWRIHDWRCSGTQYLDGIDLTIQRGPAGTSHSPHSTALLWPPAPPYNTSHASWAVLTI